MYQTNTVVAMSDTKTDLVVLLSYKFDSILLYRNSWVSELLNPELMIGEYEIIAHLFRSPVACESILHFIWLAYHTRTLNYYYIKIH